MRGNSKGLRVVYESRLGDLIFRLHNFTMHQQAFSGQGRAHAVLPVDVITTPQENFGALGDHVF